MSRCAGKSGRRRTCRDPRRSPMSPTPPSETLSPSWSGSDRLVARVVAQPLQQFLRTETASGIVLLAAAVVALIWANSPWASSYDQLWSTELSVHLGALHVDESMRDWVNDLAMALFFFVAGLEIKR